jgi:tetratricopeptide (TPR) repeat protein
VENLFGAEDFKNLLDLGGAAAVEQAAARREAQAAAVPEKADAHFHLARACSLLGRKGEAREAAARALARDPGFVPAATLEVELSDRNDEEKRAAFEAVGSQHERGGDWKGWWLLAEESARQKKWPEAARAYGELIRLHAQGNEPYIGFSIDAYMAQGLAFLETKDHERAQEAFIAASALSPGAVEPKLFLAKAYQRARKPEIAAAIFEGLHAESSPRERSEIALWITVAYNSLSNFDRALG